MDANENNVPFITIDDICEDIDEEEKHDFDEDKATLRHDGQVCKCFPN
jgi:Mg/Co/Ni transporter MgtE